ncbi:hypothetical protein [Lysobacter gummosus]|uniref:hypothetical protein n=1 Tax=Lysobacter gummosus TaxID=262324 RepID=UPI003638F30F
MPRSRRIAIRTYSDRGRTRRKARTKRCGPNSEPGVASSDGLWHLLMNDPPSRQSPAIE